MVERADPQSDREVPEVERPSRVFAARPVLAVACCVAFAALCEFVPALAPLRVLSARRAPPPETSRSLSGTKLETGEAELKLETHGQSELAPGDPRNSGGAPVPSAPVEALLDQPPRVKLLDPAGTSLLGFFRALERTRLKRAAAITRITHFGDSVVASDYVSGTLRRKFQERFGDAGHGFTLIANAWPSYFHNDIERYATAGWKVSRVVGPLAEDGFYGLGCVSFRAEKNALARFSTAKKGDFGRSVSRFEVDYLAAPGGGSFEVSVDGVARELVDSRADSARSSYYEVRVPDGPHEFSILTKSGVSRLFGVTLERDVPGVVLDAVGIQGARMRFLDKQADAHWAEQLQKRRPDLLIYEFGANESADGLAYPMTDYHRTMKDVIEQGRRALPLSSCLVIGAMDRAAKSGEELVSMHIIPRLVDEQRSVASESGCAFFDTYRAMGGDGAMPSWVKRGLGQADLTHPSGAGSEVLGTWIFRALMQRYSELLATPGAISENTAPATSSPSLR